LPPADKTPPLVTTVRSSDHIAKLESRGSRGFREILDVNSLRTRVGFGFFVTQLADSKPQTPRRGIVDSRDEPGFWMGLPRTMNPGGFVRPKNSSFFATRNSQLGKELNFATLLRVRVLFFPVNSSFSTRNSEKNA
jgi:hypothetical protein